MRSSNETHLQTTDFSRAETEWVAYMTDANKRARRLFWQNLNFAGTIDSDGAKARSMGDATANGLKLSPKGTPAPRPVAMKYATAYELQKEVG